MGDERSGINYVENTGTSTAPEFVRRTGDTNPFNFFDVGSLTSPVLTDYDGDGTLIPRPLSNNIDRLRPHFVGVSQATWTS